MSLSDRITIIQGDSASFDVTVLDEDGNSADVTASSFTCEARMQVNQTQLFSITTTDSNESSYIETDAGNPQNLTIHIGAGDTNGTPGIYDYSLIVYDASNIRSVINNQLILEDRVATS